MAAVFSDCPPMTSQIGLESAHVDFVLYQHRWTQFITRLQEDWKEFILYVGVTQSLCCGATYFPRFGRELYC